MNEITKTQAKKEDESEALAYFLDAYEAIMGESIEIIDASERPDFVCQRAGGVRLGVELARIRRQHPEGVLWDRILRKQDFMSVESAVWQIQVMLSNKEAKRRQSGWQYADRTILVLQLTDIPLWELSGCLQPSLFPDLRNTGFSEVWLADYTGSEAYDNVELFCLHPTELWGYYRRPVQKPYG